MGFSSLLGSDGRAIPLSSSVLFPSPVPFLPTAAVPYLNEQSTIIVARQGFFSTILLVFPLFFVFVFRRSSTFLFILYIAFSYCLSFSSNIVDYIVFLPRTTHPHNGIHCYHQSRNGVNLDGHPGHALINSWRTRLFALNVRDTGANSGIS